MTTRHPFAADGLFWRRLAHAGATRGPTWFRRYSPPLFGLAFAAAMPSARRTVAANLVRIRGEAGLVRDVADVARTFASYASCLTDALASDVDGAPSAVVYGERHILAALEQQHGAVFATAHTGGWEVVGPLLMRDHGRPVVMVMQRERDTAARRLQDDLRTDRGLRIVHVGSDPLAALPLLSHVRAGGVVALQIDRSPAGMRTRAVSLFGHAATLPEGPLRLAQLAGAPLLPVFAARTGYRSYLVRAFEPICVPRRASQAELDAAAQRLADAMSAFISAHPTQWFRFHDDAASAGR